MSGDYSRISFDPWQDFCGVLMQQGKVQLDSDWNEWIAIVERRLRAGTLDTVGEAAVPRETPDGFRIEAVGGVLKIHPGRIYVDGILAENRGSGALQWEPHLAEQRAPDPLTYTTQPYLPNPPVVNEGGPYVAYLDVWQREVTHLQQPALIEKALGVDTTARLQTVWQVKLWTDVGDNVSCATALDDLPGWTAASGPSGGRLSTAAHQDQGPDNPCLAPPTGGYAGLENQLYRIEIHTPGDATQARFKWSRDNASVTARVLGITANTTLVVDSVGKDKLLRFADGDWVEITDDWRELNGLPGEIRRIKLGGGVDDATNTILLEQALPPGEFPIDAQNNTREARHTRILRWDQQGKVLREDGTVYHDLDAAGSDGLIPVPPAGARLRLEQGVLVAFDLIAGGVFRRLDYWTFAARSADASLEILDRAPPRGIHHHHAKLAIVTFPDGENDCRTLWPPAMSAGDCGCTVCVKAEEHNGGKATIQQAINSLGEGGGTVCLEAGVYRLNGPLDISQRAGVRLRGHGVATVLMGGESGNLVRVLGARSTTIENLALVGSGRGDAAHLVAAENVVDLVLHRVYGLSLGEAAAIASVVGFSGAALGVEISDCVLFGAQAIGFAAREAKFFFGADVRIDNNLLVALRRGVWFDGMTLFAGNVGVSGNVVLAAREAGITLGGASLEGAHARIVDNSLYVRGVGIAAGINDVTVCGNLYAGAEEGGGDGVLLQPGLLPSGMRRAHVCGNRILNAAQAGIRVTTPVAAALIADNFIDGPGSAGISIEAGAPSVSVIIARNHLTNVAAAADVEGEAYAGISVLRAAHAAIDGNVVAGVGRKAARARAVAGIGVMAVDELRVGDNHLSGIAARDGFIGSADGVLVIGPQLDAQVGGNSVHRRADDDTKMGDGRWCGIRLPSFSGKPDAIFTSKNTAAGVLDALSVVFLGDRVIDVAQAARNATVRGNRVQGQDSRMPFVLVENVRSTVFAENQVEVAASGGPFEPMAVLRRGSFTAQANVLRSQGDLVTLRIDDTKSSLAIGNLSTGPILIDGTPLQPPLDKLNVTIA